MKVLLGVYSTCTMKIRQVVSWPKVNLFWANCHKTWIWSCFYAEILLLTKKPWFSLHLSKCASSHLCLNVLVELCLNSIFVLFQSPLKKWMWKVESGRWIKVYSFNFIWNGTHSLWSPAVDLCEVGSFQTLPTFVWFKWSCFWLSDSDIPTDMWHQTHTPCYNTF